MMQSVETISLPTTEKRPRKLLWYSLPPGLLPVVSLALSGILLLSKDWFPKGWAVLIAIASVVAAIALMLFGHLLALLFRRRFQFSMRSLFVLTIAVAVPFSWLAVEMKGAKNQRKTVESLRKLGCKVCYDYEWNSSTGNRIAGALPPGAAWLRETLRDDFFCDANFVEIRGSDFNVELDELLKLKRLKWLSVLGATDETLEPILQKMSDLQYLNLWGTFSHTQLERLNELKQLQHLSLKLSQVSEADLERLHRINYLDTLDLREMQNKVDSLKYFKRMKRLRVLDLPSGQYTDAEIEKFREEMPNALFDY